MTIEVLRTMPAALREGALALGATRWEAIRAVVLPYASRGILGAIILGLARAMAADAPGNCIALSRGQCHFAHAATSRRADRRTSSRADPDSIKVTP
ncbi:MAG TPA: ABC transporter permease subunit, partial [Polyangia bacterium]